MEKIQLSQLSAGSIFKIGFFCLLGICLPFGILVGLMAMSGTDAVQVNGRYVHGVGGLVAGIVLGFLFPAILAGMMTLGGLPARLFGGLLPNLTLRGGAQAELQRQPEGTGT